MRPAQTGGAPGVLPGAAGVVQPAAGAGTAPMVGGAAAPSAPAQAAGPSFFAAATAQGAAGAAVPQFQSAPHQPARGAAPTIQPAAPIAVVRTGGVAEQVHRHRHRGPVSGGNIALVFGLIAMMVLFGVGLLVYAQMKVTEGHDTPAYRLGFDDGSRVGELARRHRQSYNPRPTPAMLQSIKGLPPRGTPEFGYFLDGFKEGYDKAYYNR